MANYTTSITLRGVDKLTRPSERMAASLGKLGGSMEKLKRYSRGGMAMPNWDGISKAAGKVGAQARSVAGNMAKLGAVAGGAAAGALYLFKTQLIDSAAQFESFNSMLEQAEGSPEAAKKSMDWITQFADSTPYTLDQVAESFVRLRNLSMEPIEGGLLESLGDTAAAMQKPVMQAVEAIADAVTGENERLKEFGIKASTKGDTITYSYTDKAGKQREAQANKNNRAQIQSTLQAIWNEKYAGSMKKMSTTWTGMLSTLESKWDSFKRMIMNAGTFDFLKGKLEELLAKIDQMAKSGELEKWAKKIGKAIEVFVVNVIDKAPAALDALIGLARAVGRLVEFVGGVRRFAIVLAGVAAAPTIVSMVKLTASFGSLINVLSGGALAAASVPIYAFAAAIAGLGLAFYQLQKHWDELDVFEGLAGIKETLFGDGIGGFLMETVGGGFVRKMIDPSALIGDVLDDVGDFAFGPASVPPPVVAAAGAAGANARVEGEIVVKAEKDTKITRVGQTGDVGINPDAGATMMGGQ